MQPFSKESICANCGLRFDEHTLSGFCKQNPIAGTGITVFGQLNFTPITFWDKISNISFSNKELDILMKALDMYYRDAVKNLERKDLGDIEAKNYKFQLNASALLISKIEEKL